MMKLDGWVDGGQHDEFQVISYRDSMESIKGFAGSDIRRTRDMPCAPEFLVDAAPFVRNYTLMVNAIRS
jgi:hypothetical protein